MAWMWKNIYLLGYIVFVSVGLVLYVAGVVYKTNNQSPGWGWTLAEGLGAIILTGGVFTLLLKTLQYAGVFQEEIRKVIVSPELLCIRTDLESLWKNVTRLLYELELPEIADNLESVVTTTYFPVKHQDYRGNYTATIVVTDFADPYMDVEETVFFDVFPSSMHTHFEYKYSSVIPLAGIGDTITHAELLECTVDGECFKSKCQYKSCVVGSNYELSFTAKKESGKKHQVVVKTKKKYSINTNPIKSFTTTRFIKGATLNVQWPQSLEVHFVSRGTTSVFQDIVAV